MQFYGISEGRIKRIIRFPTRTEEGVAEETVAVMQPAGSSRYSEIWVMYALTKSRDKKTEEKELGKLTQVPDWFKTAEKGGKKIRIITAWRYPGKSPERNPIPDEIISEIKSLL
jgi:hypothetical protein